MSLAPLAAPPVVHVRARRGAVSSYMKVVPSIASVRFLYEVLIQAWGTGGIRRYRTMEQG